MNSKLLLIAGNYYPEPTGIGRYNSEMIDWLADNGFECTVISTYPYYPYWKVQPPYNKRSKRFTREVKITAGNNKIMVYRCPHYTPANPTGAKRMLFDFTFFISVIFKLISLTGKKFDYVMTVAPPLPLGVAAAFYKSISKAKFLYHIQDLQVDAAKELNMISSKMLLGILFKIESFILRKADRISTISKGIQEKAQTKTDKKIYLFPNWTNTNHFYRIKNNEALKESFGLKPYTPVILYSGAIGEKQGLENVLWVAEKFKQEQKQAQFIICGTGPYKMELEQKAAEMKLDNIRFLPLQPEEKLNEFLNTADVHLIIQKAGVANLVMPSKLGNICSVGGLVAVTAEKGSALYNTVVNNNLGLVCLPEDITELKKCFEKALATNDNTLQINARSYAEKHLCLDKIMQQYVTEVLAVNLLIPELQLSLAK
ncbi:WcaI family glycosyltransferase [Parafilimonas terrae]|uniref:Colanic acid biosynthesis glycosyl transferase WcaI n=1 Tax=Parafilimonas terrae TaxID=1465490 RepID=A0A1I5Z3M2_9BACT|nr:WcaI family glycosyltransferase [Parafilimonas terrae]SFQ51040.1 colanic acid biosynthesis glycosyl transferase WcaI [Parafilimonas terrae]